MDCGTYFDGNGTTLVWVHISCYVPRGVAAAPDTGTAGLSSHDGLIVFLQLGLWATSSICGFTTA